MLFKQYFKILNGLDVLLVSVLPTLNPPNETFQ